jgi:hypothetical protein
MHNFQNRIDLFMFDDHFFLLLSSIDSCQSHASHLHFPLCLSSPLPPSCLLYPLPINCLTHQQYCLSQHPLRSPIKAREIILTQVRLPLFLCSLLAFRCPKMRPLFPVCQSEHTLISPRYPRGLPLGLDLSRVIGIAADAVRCSRGRIRQACIGRFEPSRGTCHPPRPRINCARKAC